MIIQPKVRGFVCITAHPKGCEQHILEEIDFVKNQKPIAGGPGRVLVIGGSTGYGLSSRIVPTFSWGAKTIGVFFERPPAPERPATAGWYNSVAFKNAAEKHGFYARNVNGDAFSDEIKTKVGDLIEKDWGQVDLIVYSLASPRRKHPKTGIVYASEIKPIGNVFKGKSIDTDRDMVIDASIEPATPEEIAGTVKVMGGEDWEMWIEYLHKRGLLAKGFRTVAYSYEGPDVTWPVYKNGTIGKAKEDLERAGRAISEQTLDLGGRAFVSFNKAVDSQASAAIPVVPLYNSILLKVMQEHGVHEDIVQQIFRLFADHLAGEKRAEQSDSLRIRIDDLELRSDVQKAVAEIWPKINTENLRELSGFDAYKREFLRLFGFEYEGVAYDADVDLCVDDPDIIS